MAARELHTSNVRRTAKSGLMDGEANRPLRMPDLWQEFAAVASRSMLDLCMQGMPYEHLLAATQGRLKKQVKHLASKRGKTDQATTHAIVRACRCRWERGTRTLDMRNSCLRLPGPARRPKCAPGDATPLPSVNSARWKSTVTKWQVAEPYRLSESSWKKATLVFDSTGRCNVHLKTGQIHSPEGGFYHDKPRKVLHAPVTGQVYFLRLEGQASGHGLHQSHA